MCKAECEFSIKITPYIDGELSGEEASAVSEHLNSCEECSALHTRLKRVVDIACELPQLKPESSAYLQNLRGRIDKPAVSWLPSSLSSVGRQVAFAGISLVVLAGIYFGAGAPGPVDQGGVVDTGDLVVADSSTAVIPSKLPNQLQNNVQPVEETKNVETSVVVVKVPDDLPEKKTDETNSGAEKPSVNQPEYVVDKGNEVIASVALDSGSVFDTPSSGAESPISGQQNNSFVESRISPKTTSGIDWDAVDLKSALVNSQSSKSGSSSMVYPPVFSSYEQVAGLYGSLASDYSSSDVQFDDSTVKSGGIVILKVHNQTEFWPSLYKHLLDDEDYRVRFIAYNQYEESKIVVDYSGSESFEAGFTSFASRVQSLSSVVGLLIIKTGEPDSSVLTLTIRPSEKSSSH
jgi:hypothetical protein